MNLLTWNIYEISAANSSLNGVMLRGRIRKLGIEQGFNVLAENTEDKENGVRFAVLSDSDAETVTAYLHTILSDVSVARIDTNVQNPVLSKCKVNDASRYTL